MLFKLHFLFGCCSYEWFLCGLYDEGHSVSSGYSQAASASLGSPHQMVRKVLKLCEEQLCQVQELGLPFGNLICCYSAFCLKILARTTPLHSTPRKGIRTDQYSHFISMKMELQKRQMTYPGTQLDSILLDRRSSSETLKCFLSHNRNWVPQEDVESLNRSVFLKSCAAIVCFIK